MQNPGFLPDPGFTGHYHDGVPCNDARQHYAATGESGIIENPLVLRPVWSLAVLVSTGDVLRGFTYEQAREADFHVDFYWPDYLLNGWLDGTIAFACYNAEDHAWIVEDEAGNDLTDQLLPRILEQASVLREVNA